MRSIAGMGKRSGSGVRRSGRRIKINRRLAQAPLHGQSQGRSRTGTGVFKLRCFGFRWLERDFDFARTRSIRELALLATERAAHENPHARNWNGQERDRGEARAHGLDAHERPGPKAIAKSIDECVDKALRLILYLAFDN